MSQRLLISAKKNVNLEKDHVYDCIYTEDSTHLNLIYEWCCYNDETGAFLGPWKIFIKDEELMDKFNEDFKKIQEYCYSLKSYDDVWGIYDKNRNLIHLSESEDKKYLKIINCVINKLDK